MKMTRAPCAKSAKNHCLFALNARRRGETFTTSTIITTNAVRLLTISIAWCFAIVYNSSNYAMTLCSTLSLKPRWTPYGRKVSEQLETMTSMKKRSMPISTLLVIHVSSRLSSSCFNVWAADPSRFVKSALRGLSMTRRANIQKSHTSSGACMIFNRSID